MADIKRVITITIETKVLPEEYFCSKSELYFSYENSELIKDIKEDTGVASVGVDVKDIYE